MQLIGSRCPGHARRLIIPLSVVRTRLNSQGVQKSLRHLRIIEVTYYTMTIASRIFHCGIILNFWGDREISSVKWIQGYNIASIKRIEPFLHWQGIS
jgi:hypothetical protein